MLQCIWQKRRQRTRPQKVLRLKERWSKMAISHATKWSKWHQKKKGCLGCSCGDWCWTAVLANLNTIDCGHTHRQQWRNKRLWYPSRRLLAKNSCQQIFFKSILAGTFFQKNSNARRIFSKPISTRTTFHSTCNCLWCHEAFLVSRSMVEDSASPKVSCKPWERPTQKEY